MADAPAPSVPSIRGCGVGLCRQASQVVCGVGLRCGLAQAVCEQRLPVSLSVTRGVTATFDS
jgi:hypothetical protein